uniref:Uncharacterized protein n=1 Tax=Knipowitschia caucasica TaxID=637954 RepID=A0AAV2KT46_KNICA
MLMVQTPEKSISRTEVEEARGRGCEPRNKKRNKKEAKMKLLFGSLQLASLCALSSWTHNNECKMNTTQKTAPTSQPPPGSTAPEPKGEEEEDLH